MMSYVLCPCCPRAGYLGRYRDNQSSPGPDMAVAVTSSSNGGPLSQADTPRVPLSVRSEGGTRQESGVTQVHAAAVNGDRQTLARLLALSAAAEELDVGDQFGRSPLMYCVLADRPECAEILIKSGAQVNLKDKGGRTALHWAAHKGNLRLIKLLLTRGADCREKDNEGQTALHLCTRHKLPKVMALLLRQLTPGEIDDQDKNKRTALHWAASHGNLEHVKMLIKQNSNIGIPDTEGKTPLHWAASSQDKEALSCVKLVLETTPSVINWQDYEGRTALHLAVADGNESVVNVLTSVKNVNVSALDNMFRTPLHWAAVLGHSKIVAILLDSGADSASSDANGATALHYAAQNNFSGTVSVFLSRHLTDEPDLEGRTAFMWAAGTGADDVIRASLSAGVDIQQEDKTGGTALHAAALSGHSSTVKLLLDSSARLEVTDQAKHTPLFRACEMGHMDVVQTLIDYGARVDGLDQDGRSPLHWAALGGHAYICQMLIKYGDGPNVRDHSARAPLHCAAYGGFVNCMSALMEHGAEPNAQDIEGMTCLHWACSKGHLDAVKLLVEYNAFPNHMEFTEDRYTPLDYALMGEHHEVAQYMIEQGALSITGIQDIAAQKIQCAFRGYRVRKAFIERKKLLMKHEKLKKEAARKRAAEEGKKAVDEKKSPQGVGSGGTSPQSRETSDSNQDLKQQQQQQSQTDLQLGHQTESTTSVASNACNGDEMKLEPQEKSQVLVDSEEAVTSRDHSLEQTKEQHIQSHQPQQQPEKCFEDQQPQLQHQDGNQDKRHQQQQQREEDEHTQMLRQSRLKIRKSEERRRKLLEREKNAENNEDNNKDHHNELYQEPVVLNISTELNEKDQQEHLTTVENQDKSEKQLKRNSYKQEHVEKGDKPPEETQTHQLKKHRSRSRRKRRSRSRDSTRTPDSCREISKDKSSERATIENSHVITNQETSGDAGEKEHHRQRRARRHREEVEVEKSKSLVLPPSPRKEPLSSTLSGKEDVKKKEDTHLPALVSGNIITETVQQSPSEGDLPILSSPERQRETSKSPASSPFPSSRGDSHDKPHHHRSHRHKHGRDEEGRRSRRRSRPEAQLDTEPELTQRTDLDVDVRSASVSPAQSGNREKHRHRSRKHRGDTDGRRRDGSSRRRKSRDREKPSKDKPSETEPERVDTVNLERTGVVAAGEEKRDRNEPKPSKDCEIDSKQQVNGQSQEDPKGFQMQEQQQQQQKQQLHKDCQQQQQQHQEETSQAQQQQHHQLQQQQQQQDQEKIRQAQLRRHELSKRYQGERMHSSHRKQQLQTPQNSTAIPRKDDPKSKDQRSPSAILQTPKPSFSLLRQKPPEPDEGERVLAGRSQTHTITMNERKRREEFQRKMDAATVIQRSWRRHYRIKSSKRRGDILLDCTKMSVHKKRLRATQEEWERQIAALTIQLAWRKFFRRKLLRALHPNRRQLLMWDPEIIALKQQALVHYIYNEHIEAPFWHPTLRPAIRPLWTRFIPSAAAVSYNFAVDQYYPWVARAGAIPEFPPGTDPMAPAMIPVAASPQTGSVKSDTSSQRRTGSRAGSRTSLERGKESSARQQKSASTKKTKSAHFSYNMRKK